VLASDFELFLWEKGMEKGVFCPPKSIKNQLIFVFLLFFLAQISIQKAQIGVTF